MSAVPLTPNIGATPPGTTVLEGSVLTTNSYQTLFDLVDNMGMQVSAELKNDEAANDGSYVLTTQDMFGTETIASAADITHAVLLRLGGAGRFYKRFKVAVKSKVDGSAIAALGVRVCAIHTGRVTSYTG